MVKTEPVRRPRQTPECLALKIEMLKRDISAEQLARMAGTTANVVRNILAGRNRCRPGLRRIEDALQLALWSDLEAFRTRQKVSVDQIIHKHRKKGGPG